MSTRVVHHFSLPVSKINRKDFYCSLPVPPFIQKLKWFAEQLWDDFGFSVIEKPIKIKKILTII